MDFDAFYQGADDIAFGGEIDCTDPIVDGSRKFFETVDDQEQLQLSCLMSLGLFNVAFELLQPDLQLTDLWLEVRLIDDALRVAINKS